MANEEYEIDNGPELNKGAKAIVDHFMSSELKEADLKEYLDLKTELDALADLVEQKRKHILEVCKGMESAKAGNYVAFLKAVKGRKTVDWQGYVKAQIKNIPESELAPYTKQGEDSVRLEVKRI